MNYEVENKQPPILDPYFFTLNKIFLHLLLLNKDNTFTNMFFFHEQDLQSLMDPSRNMAKYRNLINSEHVKPPFVSPLLLW